MSYIMSSTFKFLSHFIIDLSTLHCNRSALALIDSHTPWDMHRPLEDSCTLQLLHFTIADPHLVNRYVFLQLSG